MGNIPVSLRELDGNRVRVKWLRCDSAGVLQGFNRITDIGPSLDNPRLGLETVVDVPRAIQLVQL